MSSAVFLFGAGASAPFGIPTMQQMVIEFEKELNEKTPPSEEARLYGGICNFLNRTLGRPTDLEAVFTVVDSIINWSPDRMGIAALYHAVRSAQLTSGESQEFDRPNLNPPSREQAEVAKKLKTHFEGFVREKCRVRDDELERIEKVYGSFFSRLANTVPIHTGWAGPNRYAYGDWPIFTTNYDPVLEHYWIDIVQLTLNSGFTYNNVARMEVSNPERMRDPGLRLFKLHGSITWLLDGRWGLTEQRAPPEEMKTFTGRKFLGQVMLYPIEEKELYVEPYMTMYLMLNRELDASNRWIAVGYSFGDRIIRDIFVRNSKKDTTLALLHPRAKDIAARLEGFKGRIAPVEGRFGLEDYDAVNNAIAVGLRG